MRVSGVIAATFIFMLAVWESDAQTKSMGTFFAPDRTGFSHQRFLHDGTFWNIDLAVDYGACVLRQGDRPGGRLSLGYNFIVWEKDHPEGHSRIYAGPGVSVGYVTDKDSGYGGMAGISGNAGYEYDFGFPITVSVSLSPYSQYRQGTAAQYIYQLSSVVAIAAARHPVQGRGTEKRSGQGFRR